MKNTSFFFWYLAQKCTKHIICTLILCSFSSWSLLQWLCLRLAGLLLAAKVTPHHQTSRMQDSGCQERASWLVLWGSDSVFSHPSWSQASRLRESVDTSPFWTARSWWVATRQCLCAFGRAFCACSAPPSAALLQVSLRFAGCGGEMNSVFLLLPQPSHPPRGGKPLRWRPSSRQRRTLARMCCTFFRDWRRLTC